MDPDEYFDRTRMILVAGKGGVGKTVLSACLARLAARTGRSTLLVEIDGRSAFGPLFGVENIGYDEVRLAAANGGSGEIRGRTITPDVALVEWLDDHGLKRVSKRLVKTGAVDVISTATPGIKDLLVLGKIKQLVHESDVDVVIVDAPAAGHAMSFLRAPAMLAKMAKTGPIHAQATAVLEMLGDASQCEVMLVTLPEETPVNELIDTAFQLEDDVGIQLAPVVVNGLYPIIEGLDVDLTKLAEQGTIKTNLGKQKMDELTAAGDFRQKRTDLQSSQAARLAQMLPLEQLTLPYIFDADIGLAQIDQLADALAAGIAQLTLEAT